MIRRQCSQWDIRPLTTFLPFRSSFVIYRCEKNYMRRRLQESFHISPSGGTMSTHLGGHIPSISVSVQTEPMMTTLNGNGHLANLANTAELLVNGHSQARPNYSSATLPHNAHLVSSLAHQNSHDLEDHDPSRNHNGNGAGAIWTSMMHTAQSFRDVRDVIAMSHSRDNTLNREALHHSVRLPWGVLMKQCCHFRFKLSQTRAKSCPRFIYLERNFQSRDWDNTSRCTG